MSRAAAWGGRKITHMTDQSWSRELVPADDLDEALSAADMSRLAEQLVASAAQQGVQLTGQGGLLTALTRQVLQTALEVEMSHHLGYDKHDPQPDRPDQRLEERAQRLVHDLRRPPRPEVARCTYTKFLTHPRSSAGYLFDVLPDMTPSFPRNGVSGHAGAVHGIGCS